MSQVIVAGSINMDVVARTPNLPRPGETLVGRNLAYHPGGKGANQAVAAAQAGAQTRMIGKLGSDGFADQLETFLAQSGVDTSHIDRVSDATTGTALIVVDDGGENTIVVVPGANGRLEATDVAAVRPAKGDLLISQFETPLDTVEAFFSGGRAAGAITMLNPAPAASCPPSLLAQVDVMVMNETELGALAGQDLAADASQREIAEAAKKVRSRHDQIVIVTLGARGALAIVGERVIETPGHKVQAVDTTGAGDCFVGSLGARLAAGDILEQGLRFANTAASICVQRIGAGPSMPSFEEVESVLAPATRR